MEQNWAGKAAVAQLTTAAAPVRPSLERAAIREFCKGLMIKSKPCSRSSVAIAPDAV